MMYVYMIHVDQWPRVGPGGVNFYQSWRTRNDVGIGDSLQALSAARDTHHGPLIPDYQTRLTHLPILLFPRKSPATRSHMSKTPHSSTLVRVSHHNNTIKVNNTRCRPRGINRLKRRSNAHILGQSHRRFPQQIHLPRSTDITILCPPSISTRS